MVVLPSDGKEGFAVYDERGVKVSWVAVAVPRLMEEVGVECGFCCGCRSKGRCCQLHGDLGWCWWAVVNVFDGRCVGCRRGRAPEAQACSHFWF